MKKLLQISSLFIVIGLALGACIPLVPINSVAGYPTINPGSAPQSTMRAAQVQSVEVQVSQTDPGEAYALIRGNLTESCAALGPTQVSYASNVFTINVVQISPVDRGCIQILTPFETMIALDTGGLAAGSYMVTANGVSAFFTLVPNDPAPTAAPTPVPTSTACVDAATFIADVTIPDYSRIDPGSAFMKTWRLRNAGTCTWNSGYLVAYISGATMSQQPGYWLVQPGESVAPGEDVDISIGMTAPMEDGTYTSYWGLKKENGRLMPIYGGANGNSFFVKIRVRTRDDIPSGQITDASIDIEREQGSGPACTIDATYFVYARISADGPARAAYEIGSTAGQTSAGFFERPNENGLSEYLSGSIAFHQAGTKTIALRFVGPYPYPDDITVLLRVNGGDWIRTKLRCR